MQEKWIRWELIPEFANIYWLEKISISSKDVLCIKLTEMDTSKQGFEINFHDFFAYRHANESFSHDRLPELLDNYPCNFFRDWRFFKIEHSNFLNLFISDASYVKNVSLTHYLIRSADDDIDIIASQEPKIEWFNKIKE